MSGKRVDDKQLAAAAVRVRELRKEISAHDDNLRKCHDELNKLIATLRAELGNGIPF